MRPHEAVKKELVQQWLEQAEEDLGLAGDLVSRDTPYLMAIAFHSQQAAEKYLKAFLVHHQCEFPKTHDIGQILDLVTTIDQPLAESLRAAADLSPYAVGARYPGDVPDVSRDDAKDAFGLAQAVRDKIVAALRS